MQGKNPLTSKTLWVNLIAVAAMLAQGRYGFVIGPESQGYLLGAANLLLRVVTRQPLEWNLSKNEAGWVQSMLLPWLLITCLLLALLPGCSGPNALIKIDGKVDQVEAALIQTAVGVALTAKPEAVPPAYAVSTAILARIDGGSVLLSGLDAAVQSEVDDLDLLTAEKQSVMDLVSVIRATIISKLEEEGITDIDQRLVVVKQVIEIVRASAASRLGVTD